MRALRSSELLGPSGPLAARIDGFRARPHQQELADLVEQVSACGGQLVCEAGTGTGKTFAYLVPSLKLGRRTIISTATKTLQDQLFHRDVTIVRDALDATATVALLKGRASYLCLQRLAMAEGNPQLDRRDAAHLEYLRTWSGLTQSGDRSEAAGIGEDAFVWPLVTSTVDNCLGQTCPRFDDCFVVRARRAAAAADIVIVNHHLLFADLVLREDGFAEILPTAATIVVDEAHRLPEIASQFFSQTVSIRQIAELCRDVADACREEAPDMPALARAANALDVAARQLRIAFGAAPRRAAWTLAREPPPVAPRFVELRARLADLNENLARASERGAASAQCARRGTELDRLVGLFAADADAGQVQWFETTTSGLSLYSTPLSVADEFRKRIEGHPAAWIFTSATLSVDGHFEHFKRQLGLDQAREGIWESPFDYTRQALLYLPGLGCAPASAGYPRELVDAILPVIAASGGRAFVLFTSYRVLDACAELLRTRIDYPILVQGTAPRAELLRRFQLAGNAVLLGTSTFWEGVDVRGESLSCVIIDKLPFAPPDDPVMRARLAVLTEQGHNAFLEYQVPEAIISLKQGAGRLIRDIRDRGVLVLCDPRIERRGYGAAFLKALPAMPVTHALADVREFFADAGGATAMQPPAVSL